MSFYVDNFETVYGSTDNIQALRNKVLELAIQGKLVEQDANDEPALELIKRIKDERERLIKEGKLKKEKLIPKIKEYEIPFKIPESWAWAYLDEISIPISDNEYKIKTSEICENGHIPVVSQSQETIIGYSNDESKMLHISSPVVIFGDHTKNVKYIDFDFIVGADGVKILQPCLINDKYFYYLILFISLNIGDRGYGRHFGLLKEELMPIPTLPEQKRIVAKVESLMSEIDKLEEKLQKKEKVMNLFPEAVVNVIGKCQNGEELKEQLQFVIDNFETIFQTPESMQELRNVILQLAIEGKLVEQDKNDEPASELINRIKVEKDRLVKEGKIKKEKTLPKIEENEIPFKIPESWEWVRLGHINIYINGDRSSRYPKDYDLVEDGIPFISTKNFLNGYVNLNDSNMQFISFEKFKELSSGKLEDSDLLFVLRGSVGKMAEFKADDKYITGFINAQIVISRLVSKSVLGYSKLFYKSSEYFRQMNNRSSGSAVPQLSADELSRIIIPIPPLAEQQRIVQRVESIMKLIDQMENKLKRKKVLVEKMASV